ncbi:hypothetical protein D3C86_2152160 [compost metagenome]
MRHRGRADDHGVGGVQHRIDVGDARHVELRAQTPGHGSIGIGNERELNALKK